ncbi:MAG TPA: hypothetical protein VI456_15520 [Polyangia bacterium]
MFERLVPWLQENFWVVWLGGLWLTIVTMLVGAIRRRSRGSPIFRPAFSGSLFEESWRSGGRGIVGAGNCVWVSLLPDRLVTGLHFPFNLGIPRRVLRWAGLDNDIPLVDVLAVDNQSFFGRQRLQITYRTPSGDSSFSLYLRRPDALREALAAARQRDPKRVG